MQKELLGLNDFKYSLFMYMYSICDPVYGSDILKVLSDLKKKKKKEVLPTYLLNLILMGKSSANKDIFKDGPVWSESSLYALSG